MSIATLDSQAAGAAAAPRLADHLTGRREDELAELLGFALHVRAHAAGETGPTPQTCRAEATAMFHDAACRYLHNRISEIRNEALLEHVARTRRPPGLAKLVLANVLALLIVGSAALLLGGHGAQVVAAARVALPGLGG